MHFIFTWLNAVATTTLLLKLMRLLFKGGYYLRAVILAFSVTTIKYIKKRLL